jgi:prepilin-type N-terminal cleavage/methylation domain-containing protein
MFNRKKGFTLIELVIVIAVIAIVIGAALPRLSGYMARQNEVNRDKQEYVLNKAIKQYYALTGRYPQYNDYVNSDGVFNDKLFAEDIAKKTGAQIDAGSYIITYSKTPPYAATVELP